jgi:hypothetical protein
MATAEAASACSYRQIVTPTAAAINVTIVAVTATMRCVGRTPPVFTIRPGCSRP